MMHACMHACGLLPPSLFLNLSVTEEIKWLAGVGVGAPFDVRTAGARARVRAYVCVVVFGCFHHMRIVNGQYSMLS